MLVYLKRSLVVLRYLAVILLLVFGFFLREYFVDKFKVVDSKLACLLTDVDKSIDPTVFVNHDLLKKKLKSGLPAWAKKQIHEDLKPFSKITEKQLIDILAKNSSINNLIIHVKIKNKKVEFISYLIGGMDIKYIGFYRHNYFVIQSVINYLAEKDYIDNTDFIISLRDYVTLKGEDALPVFTFAKDLSIPIEKNTILIPDWQNLGSRYSMSQKIQKANQNISWKNKKNIVFWRGGQLGSTGNREKIVKFSQEHPDKIDAKFVATYGKVSPNFVKPEEQLNYKYLLSVDGFRASWERFVWQLHSNSLVFKQDSQHVQWFYKAVQPYVHYVPITDGASILDRMEWAELHPKEVQTIIKNSTEFVENNLALEDMLHYLIVLLREYNKKLER